MSLVEDGEAFIRHYFDQLYDPVKAHQYYEDNKNLKGRKPAKSDTSSGKKPAASTVNSAARSAAALASAAEKKAKLDADVAALKARLEQLRELLRSLVAEAKRRSGLETTPDGDTKVGDKNPEDKELTPAEKAKKAEEQHDYYEKTKGTLPSQESTHVLKQKIALIEKKIAEIRAKLAEMAPEFAAQVEKPDVPNVTNGRMTTQVERAPVPVGAGRLTTAVKKGDSQNGS